MHHTPSSKHLLLALLFLVAFTERVFIDLGPNTEFVTTAMLLAVFYVGRSEALLLTVLVMVISDLFLGNTSIFIFTWTGFLIPAFFAGKIFDEKKVVGVSRVKKGIVAGISSTGFFYLWTNFGVWLLDSWGMYEKSFDGLILCYINAIPFLKFQALSTLILTTLGFIITELSITLYKNLGLINFRHLFQKSKN